MDFIVNTAFLNIRKAPRIGKNIITALPKGQRLVIKRKSNNSQWWEVSTIFEEAFLDGFVASQFIIEADAYSQGFPVTGIKEVHRQERLPRVDRQARESGWSYPLGEPTRPTRDLTSPETKTESLNQIIHWLEVEKSARYQPTSQSTYCNIYAHDYCYLAGAYLPRVWWSSRALLNLAEGKEVVPEYGISIFEMNANNLYNWLVDFGGEFGWKRSFDVAALQEKANLGMVCVISARNKNVHLSGHICLVVPENNGFRAFRKSSALCPLISQAGRHNFLYKTNYNWWYGKNIAQFGFWSHE